MKLTHSRSSALLRHMRSLLVKSSVQQFGTGRVQMAVVRATEEGIYEFVFEMVKAVPPLVWSHDAKSRNIFAVAVQYRRAKIFSLIYRLNIKNALASSVDSTGNNLLHMAGMLAPSTSLDRIAGAALQMQRELQWFQVVSLTISFLVFTYWLCVYLNNYESLYSSSIIRLENVTVALLNIFWYGNLQKFLYEFRKPISM